MKKTLKTCLCAVGILSLLFLTACRSPSALSGPPDDLPDGPGPFVYSEASGRWLDMAPLENLPWNQRIISGEGYLYRPDEEEEEYRLVPLSDLPSSWNRDALCILTTHPEGVGYIVTVVQMGGSW